MLTGTPECALSEARAGAGACHTRARARRAGARSVGVFV